MSGSLVEAARVQPASPRAGWPKPGKLAAVQPPCRRDDGCVEGWSAPLGTDSRQQHHGRARPGCG